jgi:cytochrome P450
VVYKVIERSRAAIQAGDYADNLLSMMLTLVDEESGEGMTDQQMRDETMTIFLAGYETTSVALTWALPLLLHHPEYLQKVQNEIDTVLGGQPVTFSTVGQLSYTRMVLQEVLRLRPPASWLPRVAVEDDEIAGYRIPAGSMVVLPIYSRTPLTRNALARSAAPVAMPLPGFLSAPAPASVSGATLPCWKGR